MEDMEKQDWPLPEQDIVLLAKEIEQAQVFLRQSQDLRKASEEVRFELCFRLMVTEVYYSEFQSFLKDLRHLWRKSL